jgi:hypothetical protein
MLPAMPLRQWVLTLPFELRAPLAYERNLMGMVARIFADSVMGWYRRRLAARPGSARRARIVRLRTGPGLRVSPRGPLCLPSYARRLPHSPPLSNQQTRLNRLRPSNV